MSSQQETLVNKAKVGLRNWSGFLIASVPEFLADYKFISVCLICATFLFLKKTLDLKGDCELKRDSESNNNG